jgi:GcrA cell cycle regulator
MAITKNAVVGKAHRLGLPARPSPIRAQGRPQPARITDEGPKIRQAPQRTLARLGVVKQPAPLVNGAHPASKGDHRPAALRPYTTLPPLQAGVVEDAAATSAQPAPQIVTSPGQGHLSREGCKWPIGHPGRPGFRFCEAARPDFRRPYCAQHHAIAFTRVVKDAPADHATAMPAAMAERRAV